MIRVTIEGSSSSTDRLDLGIFEDVRRQLLKAPAGVDALLVDHVRKTAEGAQRDLAFTAPRDTGALIEGIEIRGPFVYGPGDVRADVYFNSLMEKRAEYVNKGTGIDGPFRRPVIIEPKRGELEFSGNRWHLRTSFQQREPAGNNRMVIPAGNGFPTTRTFVTKWKPSQKIQKSIGFIQRAGRITQSNMPLRYASLRGKLARILDEQGL